MSGHKGVWLAVAAVLLTTIAIASGYVAAWVAYFHHSDWWGEWTGVCAMLGVAGAGFGAIGSAVHSFSAFEEAARRSRP